MSIVDQIQKLADLRGSGAITDAEYQAAKRQLLGTEPPPGLDPASEWDDGLATLEPLDDNYAEFVVDGAQRRDRRHSARTVVAILVSLISLIVVWEVVEHRSEMQRSDDAEQLSQLEEYLRLNDTYYARVTLRKLKGRLSDDAHRELEDRIEVAEDAKRQYRVGPPANRIDVAEKKEMQRQEPPPATRLSCAIFDEDVSDTPIKTQVVRRLIVPLRYNSKQLHQILSEQFREVRGLRGFEHHLSPTNVYLYAHHTEESAAVGGATWTAMLDFTSALNRDPQITVNEDRIAALREKPTKRLGLEESTRKALFWKLVAAEHSASAAAELKFPAFADWEEAYALEQKLITASRSELAKEYGFDKGDWPKIVVEGIRKGWPGPSR